MLRSLKELMDFDIEATDGEIGKVNDFFFDDHTWTIRYLVADTGHWLPGRLVLLSPAAMGQPDWDDRRFPIAMDREKIMQSPDVSTDQPLSRQQEIRLHEYYDWPFYWGEGFGVWGAPGFGATPLSTPPGALPISNVTADESTAPVEDTLRPDQAKERLEPGMSQEELHGDPNLRSASEVIGYHLQATDDEIGHVEDFIVDDETWVIRYIVVDTRNWLPGKRVLVAVSWIRDVRWDDRKVTLALPRRIVKDSPDYDPMMPLNRQYEELLYQYYGRPGYWEAA